ncbi:hypothetical protein CHLNCDRAFT_136841 [Chlorella variabilis]|uniref:Uncharacterized protein n=1 Tax=Chlorella variabilis TaxID=554065 RepID=E1ZL63_CHLVA|nr:hypothetical protein CHLNCDRAFT_136841 [Chlorella variabilis]EFN53604.1 hypothetical protein CHLNCDRAFT_136841 [Chlorella variabilis]|eukprot:XP_005845706.1 hypothetical protein CHLNCDRAFT_136841 [Chlorella variabilis]
MPTGADWRPIHGGNNFKDVLRAGARCRGVCGMHHAYEAPPRGNTVMPAACPLSLTAH